MLLKIRQAKLLIIKTHIETPRNNSGVKSVMRNTPLTELQFIIIFLFFRVFVNLPWRSKPYIGVEPRRQQSLSSTGRWWTSFVVSLRCHTYIRPHPLPPASHTVRLSLIIPKVSSRKRLDKDVDVDNLTMAIFIVVAVYVYTTIIFFY